ncbi:diguanylate cyclase (plasmid) [Aliirhizobium terrae]|uniref:sensor domain-containing diguanylate cyclase n=1 Tax=Terrirhizobium terrae TaxID=2926709 RepID=UPI002576426B|nr:diguanylate cyclase [Rhizobium sp. CC-CFT758]WJH38126.1 diguanylate cyclase [Rhizobium sp. CC-CFT758]
MRFIHFRLVGPAVIALAFLIAGMATIPYYAVARMDIALRDRQETLVQRNIALWITDIEFSLTAWTIWDESIAKIDNVFDFDWTDRNIGASLIGTSRTRFVAVVDKADKLVYQRTDDSVRGRAFFERGADSIIADASGLVADIRSRELGRVVNGIPKPLTVSRIEVFGDDAVLMTASLFQPDFGTVKTKGERAPILITAMPISGSLQDFFGTRFLLDDARLSPLSQVAPERARVKIAIDAAGDIKVLSWLPPTPAADILRQSLPLIVTVGAVLLAAGLWTLSVSRRAARVLVSRERQMRHAATHDFLTGLANRSLLQPTFTRLAKTGSLAVVCLDLDGFKAVNDTHGHAIGDELLKVIASRLQIGTRDIDRLFRLGGDEFAILMPGMTTEQADKACRDLSKSLSQAIALSRCEVTIAASFGVKFVSGRETSCDAAIVAADAALYHAKSFGHGSVVVADGMRNPPVAVRPRPKPVIAASA